MSAELRPELERFLESLNIQTSCVEHPPVRFVLYRLNRLLSQSLQPLSVETSVETSPLNHVFKKLFSLAWSYIWKSCLFR